MLLFATIAIFAATAAPVQVEEIENLDVDVAEAEAQQVIFYEDAESSEILDAQEIVFDNEVVDSESETSAEED